MKLAYSTADGGVAIVHAAPREALAPLIGETAVGGRPTLSENAYVAHVLERNGLRSADVVQLPDDWTPPDAPRTSWTLTERGEIGFDPVKAAAATQQVYAAAIDRHLDKVARSKGYDSGQSLAGYANSTIPGWAAEAQAFVAWRDSVWVYAYEALAKVQGGQTTPPSVADLMGELPAIVWPG